MVNLVLQIKTSEVRLGWPMSIFKVRLGWPLRILRLGLLENKDF